MSMSDQIAKLSKERSELIQRLMKALEHLSRERQFSIMAAYMSMNELRKLVEFQERN